MLQVLRSFRILTLLLERISDHTSHDGTEGTGIINQPRVVRNTTCISATPLNPAHRKWSNRITRKNTTYDKIRMIHVLYLRGCDPHHHDTMQ